MVLLHAHVLIELRKGVGKDHCPCMTSTEGSRSQTPRNVRSLNHSARELKDYCCDVTVHDPLASNEEAESEYGVSLTPWEQLGLAHAVILAVPHTVYLQQGLEVALPILAPNGVVMDVKGILDRSQAAARGVALWRL